MGSRTCGNPLVHNPPAGTTTADQKKPWYQRSFSSGAGCLILVGIIGITIWLASLFAPGNESFQTTPEAPTTPDLSAAVRFTGTQFIITNNDVFNWSNCKLEINSGIVRGGCELTAALIAARSTATVARCSSRRVMVSALIPTT